ncbi:MAG: response regulator transcription factor [Chloroflexi bacterium]|nr:response regulator transcription factor [Chloroflexota bacterium]
MTNDTPNPDLAKILVVDDERTTRMAICEALGLVGYTATPVSTGEEALRYLAHEHYDGVILDLNLPGSYSGIDVLEQAEAIAPRTAFIILTAYASADTAITALRSGAYDYLRKPAALEVIFATVREALLKQKERQRQQDAVRLLEQAMTLLHGRGGQTAVAPPPPASNNNPKSDKIYHAANITINDSRHQVTVGQQPLELTPIEYKLLCKFVRQPNTAFSFTELAYESHGMAVDEGEARALLRTHVYRLSRKLAVNGESPLQNVRGLGYILNVEA